MENNSFEVKNFSLFCKIMSLLSNFTIKVSQGVYKELELRKDTTLGDRRLFSFLIGYSLEGFMVPMAREISKTVFTFHA